MPITVDLKYFAQLREERGQGAEQLEIEPQSVGELYASLKTEHGFRLEPNQLRMVVNEVFTDAATGLKDGDEVVFIPPVAGG